MDVMRDFRESRYRRVKEVRHMSPVSWRPEIPSLILGLTIGVCAGIAASGLSITQDNSEGSAEGKPGGDVAQYESFKFEFYEVLKNR